MSQERTERDRILERLSERQARKGWLESEERDLLLALQEIERLSWSNGEQVKEIERLRAEVDGLRKVIKEKDKRIDQLRILYPSIWSRVFI